MEVRDYIFEYNFSENEWVYPVYIAMLDATSIFIMG